MLHGLYGNILFHNVVPLVRNLRRAKNRKIAGSIPDGVIGIFHRHNPSYRTMALESSQPVTEINTRAISWL